MNTIFKSSVGIGLLTLLLFISTACSIDADNEITEGEKLSNELEELIDEKDISSVSVYLLRTSNDGDVNYYIEQEQSPFSLEEPFIKVGNTYYNLNQLSRYTIEDEYGANPYLMLYFDIYR
mgnify:CR=1 FL=1